MALQPFYTITDWQNLPSQKTALNRTNLLHTENGVKELDNRTVQLDASKADKSMVNALVKDITVDADGIFTITYQNGSVKTYDLDIEKVVVNFDITDDDKLVLTLADGTQKIIDLTRFVYSVDSTPTITMKILNRTITAEIVDGSVTMSKLDAAIQTEFRQYMLDAQSARDAALQYQKFAKRYFEGDNDFPGSETDNVKFYYGQIKEDAATSGQNAQSAAESEANAKAQADIAKQKATSASASENNAAASAQIATQKATEAGASEQVARDKASEAEASKTVAEQSAIEAQQNALKAESLTHGGVVPQDAEDNARWYYQQTKDIKTQVDASAELVIPHFYIDFATGKLMSDTKAKGKRFWISNGILYGENIHGTMIRYSSNPDGSNMTESRQPNSLYMGVGVMPREIVEHENLLTNSTGNLGNTSGWIQNGGVNSTLTVVEGPALELKDLRTSSTVRLNVAKALNVEGLDKVTLTFEYKATTGSFVGGSGIGVLLRRDTPICVIIDSVLDMIADDQWHTLSYTADLTRSATPFSNVTVYLLTRDGTVTYKNLKLERGTEATPWTPAPSDWLSDPSNYTWTALNE